MKKIYLLLTILMLFTCTKVNAIENEYLTCDNEQVHVISYNKENNLLYVHKGNDNDTYYILKDNKCVKATNDELLKLSKRNITYAETYYDEGGNDLINVYKLNHDFKSGYLINTLDFDETNWYYRYDSEYNIYVRLLEDEIDENEASSYYILGTFINLDGVVKNDGESYYKYDSDTNLFTLYKEQINEENVINIYKKVSFEDITVSKKIYTLSDDVMAQLYTNNDLIVTGKVIFDKLYYTTSKTDENNTVIEIKYYDEKLNELTEFNNMNIVLVDNYLVTYSIDGRVYKIYDNNFKLIDTINFDEKQIYRNAVVAKDKIYISTYKVNSTDITTVVTNISSTNILSYLLLIIPVVIIGVLVFIIIKQRGK